MVMTKSQKQLSFWILWTIIFEVTLTCSLEVIQSSSTSSPIDLVNQQQQQDSSQGLIKSGKFS